MSGLLKIGRFAFLSGLIFAAFCGCGRKVAQNTPTAKDATRPAGDTTESASAQAASGESLSSRENVATDEASENENVPVGSASDSEHGSALALPSNSNKEDAAATEVPQNEDSASGNAAVSNPSGDAQEPSESQDAAEVEGSADANASDGQTAMTMSASSAMKPAVMKDQENAKPSEEEPLADTEVAAAPPSESYRIFVPSTVGPLLVEVEVRVGDQKMSEAFEQHVARTIKATDTDDSGSISLDELAANDVLWVGEFGQVRVNDGQRKSQAQGYDSDRNKQIDRDELLRFLVRNGGTSRPMSLRASSYYRGQNGLRAQVAQRLDTDRDQRISAAEISAATQRLMLLDRSGDATVGRDELRPATGDGDPAWMNQRAGFRADAAILLTGFKQWNMLSYSLAGVQSLQKMQAARGENVAWASDLIANLDNDGSGQIDRIEAKGLEFATPHVGVTLVFHDAKLHKQTPPTVKLTHLDETLQASVVHQGGEAMQLQVPGLRLSFMVRDNPPAFMQQARQILRALDANNDQALDEDEFPEQLATQYGSFAEADDDGDGKLTLGELASFGQRSTPLWYFQLRTRASEQPDALFAWLDSDGDNRLITRELTNASQRLQLLDHNDDGAIEAAEIPEAYQIQFFRGQPRQDDQPFAASVASRDDDGVPEWARAMDANGDGDISAAEFLGTAKQFAALDHNHDGFIDVDETVSVAN